MNKKLLTPLFLAATFILASCSSSTIVSRPDWQNDPIITDTTGLKDNKMKAIYDAIKTLGDTNSNILNKVLYEIALKHLGTYKELSDFSADTIADVTKFDTFVSSHKCYQPKDNYGYTSDGTTATKVELNADQLRKVSQGLIQNQFKQLKLDVLNKLYDDIKGSEYVTDNLFYEDRFIMNLRKNMYDIPSLSVIEAELKKESKTLHKDVRIEAKPVIDNIDTMITKMEELLNKYLYLKHPYGEKFIYSDYIERKIYPDLFRTYLIQNYVNEQRYANLGRTYARKVDMITVPASGENRGKIRKIFEEFAKDYAATTPSENYSYTDIETALIGNVGTKTTGNAYKLLDKAGFTPITVKNKAGTSEFKLHWPLNNRPTSGTDKSPITPYTYVYKGTKLGDLVEKYLKIFDVTLEAEGNVATITEKKISSEVTTAYNDLTNSGAYSINHGLTLKERELLLTSYKKSGWYLKSGGLSDLNSTIRDRLFNISVSNIIDNSSHDPTSIDYVKKYGEKYFLTTEKFSSTVDTDRIILDSDTANLSIIQVEEAVSTSKLTYDSDNSYRAIKADATDPSKSVIAHNEIAHNVVQAAASSGDTYKKNANQYYLLISNITFYDQSVYDYFKSQYPDLFK